LKLITKGKTTNVAVAIMTFLCNCTNQKPISVSSPSKFLEACILNTEEGIKLDLKSGRELLIAGSGDNTNCYFAHRVSEKMGGKAAQMAKAVMLYSPWQFLYWYDRPADSSPDKGGAGSSTGIIKESDDLSFFVAVPTVWDDTKVLEGEIGEYATIARKSGDEWFFGDINSQQGSQCKYLPGISGSRKWIRSDNLLAGCTGFGQ